jgi:hypothetical protein
MHEEGKEDGSDALHDALHDETLLVPFECDDVM